MKCRAAIVHGVGQDWSIEEIDVDPPQAGEVLVEWTHAGLCHSDEHLLTGDFDPPPEQKAMMGIETIFPMIGGHEGAGIVREVGPGVTQVAPGDHVSASFVPPCNNCRYCLTGRHSLCDQGAGTFLPGMITDGTSRHRLDGHEMLLMAKLGTFSEFSCVAECQVIKVSPDYPLPAVAVVSCGVATGYGSAVNRAEVRPGDTVVIVGIGGVGINAVQGAAAAGAKNIIAIDPVAFKQEQAQAFGATHSFGSMGEALPAIAEMTHGQFADSVIMTPGVLYGDMMNLGTKLVGKGGIIVTTAVSPVTQDSAEINLAEITLWAKEIRGTIFGSMSPHLDIPRLLSLYEAGQLKLDELVTQTYSLEDINVGYQAMRDGENLRGMIAHSPAT